MATGYGVCNDETASIVIIFLVTLLILIGPVLEIIEGIKIYRKNKKNIQDNQ